MSEIEWVGKYLRDVRERLGLSQTEAAKLLGFPGQKLCGIELGRRFVKRLTLASALRFSEVYKIPLRTLADKMLENGHHSKNASELIEEIVLATIKAENQAAALIELSMAYSDELEQAARELHSHVAVSRGFAALICRGEPTPELVIELMPSIRMTEIMAERVMDMSLTYSPEVERLAGEICLSSEELGAMLDALQKKYFSIWTEAKNESERDIVSGDD